MRISLSWGALVLFGLVSSGGVVEATPPPPSGSVVHAWNQQALTTFRIKSSIDAEAARVLAMVNVAMYDAVNGLDSGHGKAGRAYALVPYSASPANGDLTAASAQAAHDILAALYPDQVGRFDSQLASDLAPLNGTGRINDGRSWGQSVAAQILILRVNDGSSPIASQPGGSGPGQFRVNWSNTQYRNLQPFGVANYAPYLGSQPPPLGSAAYATAWDNVRLLGAAVPADAAKLNTYQFWSLGAGTSQPPGAWIQIAQAVTASNTPDVLATARLFALLSMAMSDTVAPTYATKFATHAWRPTTAIREADTDGNAGTTADTTWSARAGSVGGTPEHWSGHSTFSAAGAEILAGFFCNDAVPFAFVSDSAPGAVARSYATFSAAKVDAGLSRIYGGLHFSFSNEAGLDVGRRVADEVLATKLLLLSGATHNGTCPL